MTPVGDRNNPRDFRCALLYIPVEPDGKTSSRRLESVEMRKSRGLDEPPRLAAGETHSAGEPTACGFCRDRTSAPKVPCDGHTTRVARLGGASRVNYLGLLAQFSISTPARRRLLDSRSGVSCLSKPEPDTQATCRGLRRAMPQASGGTGVSGCIQRFRVVRPSREA